MFEETTPEQHLAASVEVPYELRFSGLVLDWATGIVELAGGDQRELDGIRLALEETLTFIISSYDDAESWELIHIDARILTDGTAEFSMTNAGPPVHMDRIPEYNPSSPDEPDMDGLWYFLAQKMVDSLEFKNLGMDGWLVVIKQQLAAPSFETDEPEGTDNNGPDKKLNFSSRLGTADDASQLMDLTYDTYRYSYPGEEFYHKSKLCQAMEEGNLVSMLVEDNGEIIGNSSITVPKDTPHCGYLGSLMVRRAYRRTRAIMLIIRDTKRYIEANPLGVDLYYGTMVTEHPASQKAGAKVGLHPTALLLAVGAAVNYRGMNIDNAQRESFLVCARLTKTPELETLFLPKRHQEFMKPLLEKVGCTAAFAWGNDADLSDDTALSISEDHTEKNGYVTISSLGDNWSDALRRAIFDLNTKGLRTTVILVPAWRQPPTNLDQDMARLNAVFSGIKPVSASKYYLVYCAVSDKVDFDQIQLADPNATALKEHVRQLYNETLGF